MILFVHMLMGAAIGSNIHNIYLGLILAFLSHYFLDFIPHIDYSLKNIEKRGGILKSNILKITADIFLGILLIFLFSKNQPVIYICAFMGVLPDGFTVLSNIFPNRILSTHTRIHTQKVHYFKHKKISKFWRLSTQIITVLISIIIIKF